MLFPVARRSVPRQPAEPGHLDVDHAGGRIDHGDRGVRVDRLAAEVDQRSGDVCAALRHDRITAPFVLEGPMTGEMFKAYIEQFLAPTLTRGDVVLMDNVSVHKVDGIEESIKARGAIPFYLPAYSPDLNPIEQLFATPQSRRIYSQKWRIHHQKPLQNRRPVSRSNLPS